MCFVVHILEVYLEIFTLEPVWNIVCFWYCSSVHANSSDGSYSIKIIAGKGDKTLQVNVPALEASIGSVPSIVQSKKGDLYVSSGTFHVILKLEFNKLEGTWSNVEVIAGTGEQGKGADDVLGTESALNHPIGLSLIENSSGDVTAIVFADEGNHRIRKLDMNTQKIHTIAGKGTAGDTGDGGPAKAAALSRPYNAYYDKVTGDIFIADFNNNMIRRVFGSNDTITTVVGKTCTGSNGLGDGGQAVDACLENPYYFTMNNESEWFITDLSNKRIRKVNQSGIITTVAGGGNEVGDAFAGNVRLDSPRNLDFTLSDELLVADYGRNVIRKMDSNGFMRVIAGGGSQLPKNPRPAKTAGIKPLSVAVAQDGSNDIFIGDINGYVHKLTIMCYGVELDNPAVCSGHGSCIDFDQCKCGDGWLGNDCSITRCFTITSNETSVCSGHGLCIAPDRCQCDSGWMENECSVTQCFDIMSNDTSVCSGHGICIGADGCQCRDGWIGRDCSLTTCFGKPSQYSDVCSGHGSCIGLDACMCDSGWLGVDCSITHCFGVTSNLPDRVCSGKGKCLRHNKCHCDEGFGGYKCESRN